MWQYVCEMTARKFVEVKSESGFVEVKSESGFVEVKSESGGNQCM